MSDFSQKVFSVVKRIPAGKFLTYKEVARFSGRPKSFRAVGNILTKNRDKKIPCHRVIRNDNQIGGYFGSEKLAWEKAALLLKEGTVGVLATDTIYGLCGSALNKKTVGKIYKLKKRNPKKPLIILISSLSDLKKFGVKLKKWQRKYLKNKVSVVLACKDKKFFCLHRGTKTIAFRFPAQKEILKILEISGPLVAPSANLEGKKPAETVSEAREYFRNKVFYYDIGRLVGKPSSLVDITKKPIKILHR